MFQRKLDRYSKMIFQRIIVMERFDVPFEKDGFLLKKKKIALDVLRRPQPQRTEMHAMGLERSHKTKVHAYHNQVALEISRRRLF